MKTSKPYCSWRLIWIEIKRDFFADLDRELGRVSGGSESSRVRRRCRIICLTRTLHTSTYYQLLSRKLCIFHCTLRSGTVQNFVSCSTCSYYLYILVQYRTKFIQVVVLLYALRRVLSGPTSTVQQKNFDAIRQSKLFVSLCHLSTIASCQLRTIN